jgi:CheY-like chemotaxis protein
LLEKTKPDIILSDFHIPGFDEFAALAIAKEKYPYIPFIFVSPVIVPAATFISADVQAFALVIFFYFLCVISKFSAFKLSS